MGFTRNPSGLTWKTVSVSCFGFTRNHSGFAEKTVIFCYEHHLSFFHFGCQPCFLINLVCDGARVGKNLEYFSFENG